MAMSIRLLLALSWNAITYKTMGLYYTCFSHGHQIMTINDCLHTMLMRKYLMTSQRIQPQNPIYVNLTKKSLTCDATWKFPTMTVLCMLVFNVGEYTGYPVVNACLTWEEDGEEMWRRIHTWNVLALQVNCSKSHYVIKVLYITCPQIMSFFLAIKGEELC